MGILNETVKNFFKPKKKENKSSIVNPQNVKNNLSDENGFLRLSDFFDYQEENIFSPIGEMTQEQLVLKQMAKIKSYRQCAMQPEVSNALDIIANEIVFSYEGFPLKVNVEIDNDALVEAIQKCFDEVIEIGHFDKNLFEVVKSSYIDGQLLIHCQYDSKNIKKGIQKLRMIEPCGIYFDYEEKKWKYMENSANMIYFNQMEKETYDQEEIARMDFGLYEENWLCLSYLEYAIKTANMLKCLEDLLVPLRFSRSISRRVFNVDIGDLPPKRGSEYMKQIQEKFKYKKFYNNETGEINNQQHITSMVEDYWFANRGGSKGTEVSTLDESENLGEMADILYFNRKLYRSLHIPMSHLNIDTDADHAFSIDSTDTTKEDLQFMSFISRVRKVYSQLFKDLLKRQVISKRVMKETEWEEYNKYISVEFINENLFIERMKTQMLNDKISAWNDIKEIGGTVMSFKELMKRTFGLTETEIQDNLKEIETEKKEGKFNIFYQLADIEIATEAGLAGMTDPEGNPLQVKDMAPKLFTNPDDFDDDVWPDENDNSENSDDFDDTDNSENSDEIESKENSNSVGGMNITDFGNTDLDNSKKSEEDEENVENKKRFENSLNDYLNNLL